jgi:flap endonuclease-1
LYFFFSNLLSFHFRQQAEADLAAAKEAGDQEEVNKFSRRLVKVTKQHNDDCKELLRLMGVPVITAPCEAGELIILVFVID